MLNSLNLFNSLDFDALSHRFASHFHDHLPRVNTTFQRLGSPVSDGQHRDANHARAQMAQDVTDQLVDMSRPEQMNQDSVENFGAETEE